jgi:hypothetical protein
VHGLQGGTLFGLFFFKSSSMAAAISAIRKLNGGGDVAENNPVKDELLRRLPGLALREMDVVLGMLLIGLGFALHVSF